MNRIALLIMLVAGSFIACQNTTTTTDGSQLPSEQIRKTGSSQKMSTELNVEAPQWVADLIKVDPEKVRVMRCQSPQGPRYLINNCVTCPNPVTEVFDEAQNLICSISSTPQDDPCDEADELGEQGRQQCEGIRLKG